MEDDHALPDASVAATLLIDLDYRAARADAYWHTAEDTLDKLSRRASA